MLIRYVRTKRRYVQVGEAEQIEGTKRIIITKELVRGEPIGAFIAYTSKECDNKIVIGWSACNTEYENFLSKDQAKERAVRRSSYQEFSYLNATDVSKAWKGFPNHFRPELEKFLAQCKRRYPHNGFLCDYTKYLTWPKDTQNEPSLKRFKEKLEKLIVQHNFCTEIIPPSIQAENMVKHMLNSAVLVSDTVNIYIQGALKESNRKGEV